MIDLKFLGTGGIGSVRIKNKLSRDYRRFCSVLIDESILIDPSEDIFEFESTFMLGGLISKAKDIFITHSHMDRFSPLTIEKLAERSPIKVYLHPSLLPEVAGIKNVEAIPIMPFGLIKLQDHTVLPLPSNHSTELEGEIAYNYLIDSGGTTLLYALDGAWINPMAWRVLSAAELSAIVFDLGAADAPMSLPCVDHNNIEMVKNIVEIMKSSGVYSEKTKIYLSNIPASKKRSIHEELCEAISDLPFRIAYDGYFTVI